MKNQIQPIRDELERRRQEFAKVLPSHITPDKIIRSVCNALADNQYLLKCSKASILKSAMTAAVLGLEVDNAVGQGYIVPFNGHAQFIPGYKGYISLAFNSGFMISSEAVYENDQFRYALGLNPTLEHVPSPGTVEDRGAITHAYAVAHHKNNIPVFKVLDVTQINKSRDTSTGYQAFLAGKIKTSPWETHYDIMCAKTAVRSIAQHLPLNVQRAAALESLHDRGKASYIDVTGVIEGAQEQQNVKVTRKKVDLSDGQADG